MRTLDDSSRQYGYCVRTRRPTPGAAEGETDTVEVLCVLSRYLWPGVFNQLLDELIAERERKSRTIITETWAAFSKVPSEDRAGRDAGGGGVVAVAGRDRAGRLRRC